MKTKRRRMRSEVKNLVDKAEMITLLAFWAYIMVRCFLFAVGIDL